jgi:hypothetical protein
VESGNIGATETEENDGVRKRGIDMCNSMANILKEE